MTVTDLKANFEKEKTDYINTLTNYLDYKCVKSFDMYYCGWECDAKSWLMEDNTIFTTNHGAVCEMTKSNFKQYRDQLRDVVLELDEISDFLKES